MGAGDPSGVWGSAPAGSGVEPQQGFGAEPQLPAYMKVKNINREEKQGISHSNFPSNKVQLSKEISAKNFEQGQIFHL